MPDGVELLADHYFARGTEKQPIILVRSPYGRGYPWGTLYGPPLAERGYQVVVQSCRGTFGSGGQFYPLKDEAGDGLETLRWLEKQSWFGGSVGTIGPSYLGYAQWALAADAPPFLGAMVLQVTASQFRIAFYPGESFALDWLIKWAYAFRYQERDDWESLRARLREGQILSKALSHLLSRTQTRSLQERQASSIRIRYGTMHPLTRSGARPTIAAASVL